MTLFFPLLASFLAAAPLPRDTVFILGRVERDLTGDGRPEVLRLVAAGRSTDSLDVTFSIVSSTAILYTDTMAPVTRNWGYDAGRRALPRAHHRARLDEYGNWFFHARNFTSTEGFVDNLRKWASHHISRIPQVIDRDRAEGTLPNSAAAAATWEEIQRSKVTVFMYSPGGDSIRAIAWSERDQRFYQLMDCC